jgi:hypothetical protein
MRSALYALIVSASLAGAASVSTGASSPEALLKQVLVGLEARDEKSLQELVITEEEFKKYVWPHLQGTLSSIGRVRADQYFVTYMKASDAGLADRLNALGGQKWEVVKVNFGAERKGKGHRILSHAEAVLRNSSGEQKTFPIAGTVLDEGGTYKIATFWVRETSAAK